MKFLYVLAACAALTLGLSAQAQANPLYLNIHAGFATETSIDSTSLDDGATYGAALGTSVGPVRVEVGADRINASLPYATFQGTDLSASAFLDLKVSDDSAVYVGGGGDYVRGTTRYYYCEDSASGYGYHVAAGASHRISEHAIVDAQVRYISADLDGTNVDTTAFTAGIRWRL